MEDLLKGLMLKSVHTMGDIINTEKADNGLALNDKKIDDVIYKKANKEFGDRNKNIFQEQKICLI